MNAWIKRYPSLTNALNSFIDNLIDQAENDGSEKIFDYYRNLWLAFNRSRIYPYESEIVVNRNATDIRELVDAIITERPDWAPPGADESYKDLINSRSQDAAYSMGNEFVEFLIDQKTKGVSSLPDALFSLSEIDDEDEHKSASQTWQLDEDVINFLTWQYDDVYDRNKSKFVLATAENQPCCRLYYKALDARIREIMDEDDLCYILDFEQPLLGLEGI